MSFEEAYKKYLILGTKHLKKQSLKTFQNNFNLHILPYFKGRDLYEIKKKDYLEWKLKIIEKNFSNSFNNNLYVCFNLFIQFCIEYLDLKNNYIKEIGNFKRHIEEMKTDFYTLEEFNKFIRSIDDIVYKTFFEFMFYTGTRPGETMALRFSDLEDNYVFIRHNLTTKGGRTLTSPKNSSSMRKIILNKSLKKELCKLKKYYMKLYNNECFDYFIFGGIKPLAPTTINRIKLKACNKSNIRPITLHQFRHSHATLLVESNIPINVVSDRLGHSNISTTLDIYVHTSFKQEKRVLNVLNSHRLKTFQNNFKSILKHFTMF